MEITNIRLAISQPLVRKAPSESDITVDALDSGIRYIKARAFHTMQVWKEEKPEAYHHHQKPGEKQCSYCKAKVDCQKYKEMVAEVVFNNDKALDGFDTVDLVGAEQAKTYMPIEPNLLAGHFLRVPLIRAWCDAIEARTFQAVKSGEVTEKHGLKLVSGKKGNRAWDDPAEVEGMFKSMKLTKDEMYSYTLISPTKAEELLKESNPRKWTKAEKHIKQSDGSPKVVHVSDKRPAINLKPNAEGMEIVEDEPVQETVVKESPPPVQTQAEDSGDDLC